MSHTLHGRVSDAAHCGGSVLLPSEPVRIVPEPARFVPEPARTLPDPLSETTHSVFAGHAAPARSPRIDAPLPTGQGDLAALVRACAHRVIAADYNADAFRRALESEGVRATDDVLGVLTRVAHLLGDWWVEDSCTFNDVTFGMHRLTLLLIALEPTGSDPDAMPQHGGRVFLAPAPGDQHGFGLAMVGFCLRRAGWDVSAELDAQEDRIVDHIAARAYDCVGFSVGHERAIAPLSALIARIRQSSRRASLAVMVGGPMIVANPALAATMGADLWAEDGTTLCAKLSALAPRGTA